MFIWLLVFLGCGGRSEDTTSWGLIIGTVFFSVIYNFSRFFEFRVQSLTEEWMFSNVTGQFLHMDPKSQLGKVNIFWECEKIWRNLPHKFDLSQKSQTLLFYIFKIQNSNRSFESSCWMQTYKVLFFSVSKSELILID